LRVAGHPFQIAIICIFIVVNGLASFVDALWLFQAGDWVVGAISVVSGSLLLHRVYAFWEYHRTAYLVTMALLSTRSAIAVYHLIRSPAEANWLSLALGIAALAYLLRPRIRRMYDRPSSRT
jgi:hypothetical protein